MWLVAPGPATIALTYGLARFAYGLFLPEMRESLEHSDSVLGLIGAGCCLAVLGSSAALSRWRPPPAYLLDGFAGDPPSPVSGFLAAFEVAAA